MSKLACGCDYWTVPIDGEPGFTTEEKVSAHEQRHAPEWCHRCDSADYLSDEYMDGVLYLWCSNCGDEAGH